MTRPEEPRRTYYGDPAEPIEELMGFEQHGPPRDGDELCDGHQAHYEWKTDGDTGLWL